ncbi:MAG: sigma-54-dependent Fis family transcriptional regulator [Fibrobacteria bacterium]|nr:sigma-54-dependent Fis family transcriptional regulator [Fibrobacteria bacterium]
MNTTKQGPQSAEPKSMLKGNFLIVDDEEHIREILKATLESVAQKVYTAASAEEALNYTSEENLDVVICDIQMPGINGLEFLQQVKNEQPDIQFLMITAFGSMDTVIKAMRSGASDFLTKPFDNARVREIALRLLSEKRERTEPVFEPVNSPALEGIIGESDVFKKCINIAMKAASSDSSVLILGESGTGKEIFARAIHDNSSRKEMPFIPINCGAIPENLIESELFGYQKGAFTGALESKPGKFVLANNGTVFLDEIGEMPLNMQVKLLRVLQEKKVDPVGGAQPESVDFRLLAATNLNLDEEVRNGNFREDLFYRLNIIPIQLPTLASRMNDILLLAIHFLDRFNNRYNASYKLTDEDNSRLLHYTWPGNIRELENVIERAVVLGESGQLQIILPEHNKQQENSTSSNLRAQKKESEKTEIMKALERNRWNKTRTAEELGICRRSLLYKVKEYGIQ